MGVDNQLEPVSPLPISVDETGQQVFTSEHIEVVRRLVAPNATPQELQVYFAQARKLGLNPLVPGEMHMVPFRQDGRTIHQTVIGVHGLATLADRTGRVVRWEPALYAGRDGDWRDVWLDPSPPAVARARLVVITSTGEATIQADALYSEFVQTYYDKTAKTRKPTQFWATKPTIMLYKCARAQALRLFMPDKLAGVLTVGEQSDHAYAEIGPAADTQDTAEVTRMLGDVAGIIAATGTDADEFKAACVDASASPESGVETITRFSPSAMSIDQAEFVLGVASRLGDEPNTEEDACDDGD